MAKILLVDDDPELTAMVEDWLTYEKHSVKAVHNGYEGWKLLESNEFQLAILDWDLPDLNGIDLLKRYRESGGTMPIIMLTGHSKVEDKEAGLDSGANDYLTKPFHIKELAARIRSLLRHTSTSIPFAKPLGVGNEQVLAKGDLIGTSLATKYEFLEVLGEGGVGLVFKARHPQMDKIVAVKMLQSTELIEELAARFEVEARAISKLDHRNIIIVHDFGVTEKRHPYMVMEYVNGEDLEQKLKAGGALPVAEALPILIQVCDGLAHAHQLGVLHRDMKPSNIMLKFAGSDVPIVKILDFGLAKLKVTDSADAIKLTQARQVFGSPPYMSPEQVRGKPLTELSDIYSTGCTVFETLTGRPPFTGDNPVDVMFKHIEEKPLSIKEARPDIDYPTELVELVAAMLAKDPDNRPQRMLSVSESLKKVIDTITH